MQGQPPSPPVIVDVGPAGPVIRSGSSPSAIYEAYRNQRQELSDQMQRLENQRENLAEELAEPHMTDAAKRGLEARIASIDARIVAIDRQLAEADAAVARAAAVPGAVIPPPPPMRHGPPEEAFVLAGLFMLIVILPLTIAFARRIWRRGAAGISALPQDIYDRFTRVEQSLDAIAVEVERIGEGQRYLTRLHAEQRSLGGGQEQIASRMRDGERDR